MSAQLSCMPVLSNVPLQMLTLESVMDLEKTLRIPSSGSTALIMDMFLDNIGSKSIPLVNMPVPHPILSQCQLKFGLFKKYTTQLHYIQGCLSCYALTKIRICFLRVIGASSVIKHVSILLMVLIDADLSTYYNARYGRRKMHFWTEGAVRPT